MFLGESPNLNGEKGSKGCMYSRDGLSMDVILVK